MNSQLKQQQNWVVTASLSVLAVLAIAVALYFTREILIPFVVAIFIGSLVSPLMDIMELKWKWRHGVSVVVALVVVLIAAILFGAILMGSITTVVDGTQEHVKSFKTLATGVDRWYTRLTEQEEEEPPSDSGEAEAVIAGQTNETEGTDNGSATHTGVAVEDQAATTGQSATESKMMTYLLELIPALGKWVAGTSVTLFSAGTLTFIFCMFVLAGRDPKVVRQGVYAEIDTQVRSYISTKVALSLATGALVWLAFVCIGIFWDKPMPMAPVFGVIAFLLNFIPSVGSIISTLIPIPFALAMVPELFDQARPVGVEGITFLLAVVCIPGSIQMLIGNVFEPKLMGDDLQLHPITILLALAIWGLLWGPVGMLLAVPMTAIIRIVLMKFEITRIAGRALAGELPDLDAAERMAAGVEPPVESKQA